MHSVYLVPTALITLAAAAPSHRSAILAAGQAQCNPSANVLVTFLGATPEDTQVQCIPLDNRPHNVSDASSISHITTTGGPCIFTGVDRLSLTIHGAGTEDVGPPQVLLTATCGSNSSLPLVSAPDGVRTFKGQAQKRDILTDGSSRA